MKLYPVILMLGLFACEGLTHHSQIKVDRDLILTHCFNQFIFSHSNLNVCQSFYSNVQVSYCPGEFVSSKEDTTLLKSTNDSILITIVNFNSSKWRKESLVSLSLPFVKGFYLITGKRIIDSITYYESDLKVIQHSFVHPRAFNGEASNVHTLIIHAYRPSTERVSRIIVSVKSLDSLTYKSLLKDIKLTLDS